MDKWQYLYDNVNGTTNMDELFLLAKYAKEVPENGLIVDIGTCEGRSAIALAIGSKESVKIVSIDPTPNERVFYHLEQLGLKDRVSVIKKKSQEVEWTDPIDMYFNDGLHDYWGMKEDISRYSPHVKQGGICSFHDITIYSDTVGKAIIEGQNKEYEILKITGNLCIARKL